ncbi:MAG: bifunctional diaminohydroxyphosphoribosylaminopyrimidine deaminase/5-amino-6-(5-phosphoribosylamino)uracil reductase RibD [Shimia sp.]
MALALALGRRGQGRTWPNPAVGCVLVRDGRIVARGWTQPGGRPHAEAHALALAGEQARGATAYVTLEPCAHQGRAGPCADALIAAGVARVVVATVDPDPRVNERGLARLRAAGVAVTQGVMEAEARDDLRGFLSRILASRPEVTLKLAASLDGRIATASGESRWITGPLARRRVHALRASHDAVLVGAGTARADDPSLTIRGLGVHHQPVRVVCSRRLDLPLDSALARTAADIPLWLMHGPNAEAGRVDAWQSRGARLFACPVTGGQLDTTAMLNALGAAGLTRVFCEGGGALAASLLGAGCVDRLVTMSAGVALGAEGQPSLGAMGISALKDAPRFVLHHAAPLGGDVLQEWRPA